MLYMADLELADKDRECLTPHRDRWRRLLMIGRPHACRQNGRAADGRGVASTGPGHHYLGGPATILTLLKPSS